MGFFPNQLWNEHLMLFLALFLLRRFSLRTSRMRMRRQYLTWRIVFVLFFSLLHSLLWSIFLYMVLMLIKCLKGSRLANALMWLHVLPAVLVLRMSRRLVNFMVGYFLNSLVFVSAFVILNALSRLHTLAYLMRFLLARLFLHKRIRCCRGFGIFLLSFLGAKMQPYDNMPASSMLFLRSCSKFMR